MAEHLGWGERELNWKFELRDGEIKGRGGPEGDTGRNSRADE